MKTLLRCCLVALILVCFSALSFGQKSGTGTVTILKPRGVDTTFTQTPPLNSIYGNENNIMRPAEKGAPARGPVICTCSFDNRTDLFVDVYVDSNYYGTMAPWGNWSTTVLGGATKMYAIARFNDGAVRKWGPVVEDCLNSELLLLTYDETFDWTLTEAEKKAEKKKGK